MTTATNTNERENLGPAERILSALITHKDHLVHNRPGVLFQDATKPWGTRWHPVTTKKVGNANQVIQKPDTKGRGKPRHIGDLDADGKTIRHGGRVIGEYRAAGLYEEVAVWMWEQIHAVWRLNPTFVARWASYQWTQDYRDLKTLLCAYLLVQNNHVGDPVRDDDDEVLFLDDDYRAVGEAMVLHISKKGSEQGIAPRQVNLIYDVLRLPGIARLNRTYGYSTGGGKGPPMGRWARMATKWLQFREKNPKLLEGLLKADLKSTVMRIAQRCHYKPLTPRFYEVMRWKQKQAPDGRREIRIGAEVSKAEDWSTLSEEEICERIAEGKISWKGIVGRVPEVTRAMVVAAVTANCIPPNDLIILTPTLEELGLLARKNPVKDAWKKAQDKATTARASNVAKNVRSKALKESLEGAATAAVQRQVEEVTRGLRIYVAVDVSGSMYHAIEQAKPMVTKLITAFPEVHVVIFNSMAAEVPIKKVAAKAQAKAVDHAFARIHSGGGTVHTAAVEKFAMWPPKPDEDPIFFFVGDEGERFVQYKWNNAFEKMAKPVAFGMLHVGSPGNVVHEAADFFGIPCFDIDPDTFNDVTSMARTIRNLIAAAPVGTASRRSRTVTRTPLIDTILNTPILELPAWVHPAAA